MNCPNPWNQIRSAEGSKVTLGPLQELEVWGTKRPKLLVSYKCTLLVFARKTNIQDPWPKNVVLEWNGPEALCSVKYSIESVSSIVVSAVSSETVSAWPSSNEHIVMVHSDAAYCAMQPTVHFSLLCLCRAAYCAAYCAVQPTVQHTVHTVQPTVQPTV